MPVVVPNKAIGLQMRLFTTDSAFRVAPWAIWELVSLSFALGAFCCFVVSICTAATVPVTVVSVAVVVTRPVVVSISIPPALIIPARSRSRPEAVCSLYGVGSSRLAVAVVVLAAVDWGTIH